MENQYINHLRIEFKTASLASNYLTHLDELKRATTTRSLPRLSGALTEPDLPIEFVSYSVDESEDQVLHFVFKSKGRHIGLYHLIEATDLKNDVCDVANLFGCEESGEGGLDCSDYLECFEDRESQLDCMESEWYDDWSKRFTHVGAL